MPPHVEMAQARGINADMMNAQIADLIEETRIIQDRVQTLLSRLNKIREDIALYKPEAYQQTIEIAGKPREITLPVPERPKFIVENKESSLIPAETPPPQPQKKQTQIAGVTNIRTGIHTDKTRIVIDINGDAGHDIDFDKAAGFLTVSLNNSQWNTNASQNYKLSQLKGYQAKNSGQGAIIAMSVANTKSVRTSTIKKTGDKPTRLIIDLMKSDD